jgi:hypothetical protein
MKTAGKIVKVVVLALFFASAFMGCKKEEQERYGSLSVSMTDAPANFLQVNVDVAEMRVNHESKGWMTLQIKRGVYDLLQLQNNVSVLLANNVRMPIGKITQLRLVLGNNNTVVDVNGSHQLTVPSGSESGLKVNVDQVITQNHSVEILLDFDANASVVMEGNGNYSLKPVIKVKSVIQN